MGAIEVHVSAGKLPPTTTTHKSAGLQINKLSGGGCAKPRVIHTYSPRVYKIQPEEFLQLVQKLTGQSVQPSSARASKQAQAQPTTFQFFETHGSSSSQSASRSNDSTYTWPNQQHHVDHQQSANDFANSCDEELMDSDPITSHQRLVTLNFLPMLASMPRARSS